MKDDTREPLQRFAEDLRDALIARGYEAELVSLIPGSVDFWRESDRFRRARFHVWGWKGTVSQAVEECGKILAEGRTE